MPYTVDTVHGCMRSCCIVSMDGWALNTKGTGVELTCDCGESWDGNVIQPTRSSCGLYCEAPPPLHPTQSWGLWREESL